MLSADDPEYFICVLTHSNNGIPVLEPGSHGCVAMAANRFKYIDRNRNKSKRMLRRKKERIKNDHSVEAPEARQTIPRDKTFLKPVPLVYGW